MYVDLYLTYQNWIQISFMRGQTETWKKIQMLCKWQVKYIYVNWLKCFYCPNDKNVSLSEFDFFSVYIYYIFQNCIGNGEWSKKFQHNFLNECLPYDFYFLVFSNKHIKTGPRAHLCPCKPKFFFKLKSWIFYVL